MTDEMIVIDQNTKFPNGIGIESDGTRFGTRIVDIASGRALANVKRIELDAIDADSDTPFVCAKVYFHGVRARISVGEVELHEVPSRLTLVEHED